MIRKINDNTFLFKYKRFEYISVDGHNFYMDNVNILIKKDEVGIDIYINKYYPHSSISSYRNKYFNFCVGDAYDPLFDAIQNDLESAYEILLLVLTYPNEEEGYRYFSSHRENLNDFKICRFCKVAFYESEHSKFCNHCYNDISRNNLLDVPICGLSRCRSCNSIKKNFTKCKKTPYC